LRPSDLNRFLFQQLTAQLAYAKDFPADLFTYRLKSGAVLDAVIAHRGRMLGYSVGVGKMASPAQVKSAESFLRSYPGAQVLLSHLGSHVRALGPRVVEAPLGAVI
jgi:hypothetical protein